MTNDTFDFSDTIESLYDAATKETQDYGIDILEGVVAQSRVDTGRMRGNWVVGIDELNAEQREPLTSGPRKSPARAQANGDRAISEGKRDIVNFDLKTDDVIFITNNTEYVEIWNEKDSIVSIALAGADMK